MDGEEPEEGLGDGEEAAPFAALALRRWRPKSPAGRTFIRPGAAAKLDPPPRPRHRGAGEAEGEPGGREAAAAAEAE